MTKEQECAQKINDILEEYGFKFRVDNSIGLMPKESAVEDSAQVVTEN